jgi:hypothetical protein
MLLKTIKVVKYTPVRAIAVILFAVVVSGIICTLEKLNETELQHYEEAKRSIPVTVSVMDASRTDTVGGPIQNWVYDVFAKKVPVKFVSLSDGVNYVQLSLNEYVKDIQVKVQQLIDTVNGKTFKNPLLYGITSLSCEKMFLPEYGCEIKWEDGYDESVLEGDKPFCLVPAESLTDYDNGSGEVVLDFLGPTKYTVINGEVIKHDRAKYQCTLKIVGTYTAGDGKSIYCPLSVVELVYRELDAKPIVCSLSATLADNNRLEEFRLKMKFCFLESSTKKNDIKWGYRVDGRDNVFYSYALDIDDKNLLDLAAILEESIKFNRTVTTIVVVLSAVEGFVVGYLMICRRKHEIMLMRVVGESNLSVYVGIVLEQTIYIILGITFGGAFFLWKPIENLALFAIVYYAGLTLALIIFMSQKLIKNFKEDE